MMKDVDSFWGISQAWFQILPFPARETGPAEEEAGTEKRGVLNLQRKKNICLP